MSGEAVVQPSREVVQMTFARRAGTAALVLLATRTISIAGMMLYPLLLAYSTVSSSDWVVQLILQFGVACVTVTAMVLVFVHAQRSVYSGRRHWLATMAERNIILIIVALAIVSRIVPRVTYDSSLFESSMDTNALQILLMRGLSSALAVTAAYVWIWWCNSPPRAERLVAVSAIAWCGFEFLFDVLDMVVPTLNVLVSRTGEVGAIQLPGADAFVTIHGTAWLWRVSPEYMGSALISWATNVAVFVPVAAVIAVVLYVALNRDSAPAQ